jgi:hypothetical protein
MESEIRSLFARVIVSWFCLVGWIWLVLATKTATLMTMTTMLLATMMSVLATKAARLLAVTASGLAVWWPLL